MSSSDPSASEAIELEAVISSVREEVPEVTETESQANDESQDDNSKKDVKPKSNKYIFKAVELKVMVLVIGITKFIKKL